jgi:L-seryl-tRNA(Ser) seleniumtransferase
MDSGSYIDRLGIVPYINAHDTVTLYGASRMAGNTRAAMNEVSGIFVDLLELQRLMGAQIAALTHNEAAYIAGGAAAALQICAAVCMARGDSYIYSRLPGGGNFPNEFVVIHGQHICYDKAIEAAGGVLRFAGDADGAGREELDRAVSEKTAAFFYCPVLAFERASPFLEEVIEIAHNHKLPVIVDAAAQLPPAENLWKFTDQGADMVIFSGGKTLCGPQTSGLILGRRQYIEDCIRFGSPAHGVCRSAKASREDMVGLRVAVENFMTQDFEKLGNRYSVMVDKMVDAMGAIHGLRPFRVEHGSVGQSYPRAFAEVLPPCSSEELKRLMKERRVFIGSDPKKNYIILSPQNLNDEECEQALAVLMECCVAMEHAGTEE